MNLSCAYCSSAFVDDRISVVRRGQAPSARWTWGVFVAALAVPLVGVIAGSGYLAKPDAGQRCAGRLWLAAALVSSLAYIAALMRWIQV
jgi:hypothetical protein